MKKSDVVYQVVVTWGELGSGKRAIKKGDRILSSLVKKAAEATLINQNAPPGELDILVADDQTLEGLNRDFRGVPSPTDVLAFSSGQSPLVDELPHHIGDIALSLERAQAQAASAGHSLEDEIQLLIVHGTLHLLDYNHNEQADKERMWIVQAEILDGIGVPPSTMP
jgi:probable rRNA maturation factor